VPAKDKPDIVIPDMVVVNDPRDIRLIFSEKHNRILKLVMESELSISDIARALNINPGSVHYHLKELEKHGLVVQVREEVKGGIVKKYYRSSAKRILLDSPDFNLRDHLDISAKDNVERLIRSIEYLGYHLSPEKKNDAEELLSRYDRRIKDMLFEMQNSGLENVEDNGFILRNAYDLILNIKAKDDPEMARIYSEFEKLFSRYE
jgi:DNA-binding transcriptional ArsR family regulator